MIINRDFFDNPIVPDYVLCKANKERIGVLQCLEKTSEFKWCDLDEINFSTNLYIDNEKNQYYEDIDVMKYILLPDIGFYCITNVSIESEGTEYESKTVTARSCECLLAQKYLETFVINMGTVESIDGVSLYNIADKEHSLLHLVLEKCPDWKIGHIDPGLMSMQRSFEISRQNVYSFIMNDISTAFGCFFLFDSLNGIINIYKEDVASSDTNIHISYNNLLKKTDMNCSTDDIKTCLTITGADDLTVRDINMGYDRIYNFSYYNSLEYMSQGLYDAYNKWVTLRESKLDQYTTLLSQYQDYYAQINYVTYEKMPAVSGSTNWTEYGLYPLKEQLAAYEQQQAVLMKAGYGNEDSPYYNTNYIPVYNAIQAINSQLVKVNQQISDLQSSQAKISKQMSDIINLVSMNNNFTEEQLMELSRFIREEELNSDNYVVTDVMTDEEKFEMLNDLLSYGKEELAKVAIPRLTFSADILNLFAIPEFDAFQGEFVPGNYIWVTLRDDFSVKAKLLTMHINWYDPTDFNVTFGNIARKAKSIFTDLAEAIKTATSAATSVSFNQSYWSAAAKNTDNIGKMLEDGLLAAGKYLSSGDDSEMLIDSRGIFVNTTSGPYANKDSIFMGGGRILFTEDNWKTVSMAVGRADVNGESKFGVFADFLIAGYVAGSTIEGGKIIGTDFNNGNGTFHVDSKGNLTASSVDVTGKVTATSGKIAGWIINQTDVYNDNANSSAGIGTYGSSSAFWAGTSYANRNSAPFRVDHDGSLYTTSADIKGVIKADSGYIGGDKGFTIQSGKLYSGKSTLQSNTSGVYIGTDGISLGTNNTFLVKNDGSLKATSVDVTGIITATSGSIGDFTIDHAIYNGKSSLTSTQNGVYIGKDGISLGENSVFKVTQNGVLTATSGSIGGASLSANSIHASNGNWYINSDGSASFKNISITGNSSFGSDVNNPFSGTAVTHIQELAVGQITAENILATNVLANYVTANVLNAATARIDTLEADHITASEVAANYATILDLNGVNAKFKNISADDITTGTLNVERLNADHITNLLRGRYIPVGSLSCDGSAGIHGDLHLYGGFEYGGHTWSAKTATLDDGTTITYLGA